MIRKFWLTNGTMTGGVLNEWHFTDETFKCFLNNPQGLGFLKTLTTVRYGNRQNITDMTDSFPSVQGEVLFWGDSNSERYEKYNDFVRFLSHSPLVFYYKVPYLDALDNEITYELECDAVSLQKTETKTNGVLTCPVTFTGLSFWKASKVTTTGTATSYTLTNNGDFPVGFEITVKGSLTNPYITLEQDSELYGEAKFNDSTAFGEVYVDSIDGEQNVILKQGGSVLPNPLAYQDLSISNGAIYVTFVKLARGKSTLTVGMDSGSITSVDISFTPIYRSV